MSAPPGRFLGIDLGGARGKTTAVAELVTDGAGVLIRHAGARSPGGAAWTDDALWQHAQAIPAGAVIAVHAPLTAPPCVRCTLPACPGVSACVDPEVVWLRSEGERWVGGPDPSGRPRLPPYLHRATEIHLGHARRLSPLGVATASGSQVAARAGQLRRRLTGIGYRLDDNLIEVSPLAAIAAWFGERRAREYKRDADPWPTRAAVLAGLPEIGFAPSSRFARDEVLRNVHVFDAVLAAYVAYRRAREGWRRPDGAPAIDGWIWVPPSGPNDRAA